MWSDKLPSAIKDLNMCVLHLRGSRAGHLKNTPPQQVHGPDPVDPDSEEMEGEDEEGDTGRNTRGDPQDIIMSTEVGKDNKEKGQDDTDNNESNDKDKEDEDKESAHGKNDLEYEGYGYGLL